MNSFKGKEQNFKVNAVLNWKPVKLMLDWCDVTKLWLLENQSCILNTRKIFGIAPNIEVRQIASVPS